HLVIADHKGAGADDQLAGGQGRLRRPHWQSHRQFPQRRSERAMPTKKPVITVTPHSEDGPLQVEVAIPLRRRHPRSGLRQQVAPTAASPGPPRIPRAARLMALAIKFQDMVDRGEVIDYAEIARLGYVTRARLTQIMNLLLLAPDIQEEILTSDSLETGEAMICERHLRHLVVYPSWQQQRSAWTALKSR